MNDGQMLAEAVRRMENETAVMIALQRVLSTAAVTNHGRTTVLGVSTKEYVELTRLIEQGRHL